MKASSKVLAVAVAASAVLHAAALGAEVQRHVRGVIVGVAGDVLEIETGPGKTERVALAPGAQVAQVEDADPAAIAQGAFVGTTAVPQPDGTLRALEVHVFPEAMRGAGEGHRPWDLAPRSSMTNATVSGLKAAPGGKSSMTNATVSGLKSAGGTRTLTLTYPGGQQTVVVPPKIPIVQLEPGDRSELVVGAHVIAFAAPGPDGKLVAQRLTVGKGGVVPPM
jgi:hypothetical protein